MDRGLLKDILQSSIRGFSAGADAQHNKSLAAAQAKALDYLADRGLSMDDIRSVYAQPYQGVSVPRNVVADDVRKANRAAVMHASAEFAAPLASVLTGGLDPTSLAILAQTYMRPDSLPGADFSTAVLARPLARRLVEAVAPNNPAAAALGVGLGDFAARRGERYLGTKMLEALKAHNARKARERRNNKPGDSNMEKKSYDVRSMLADALGVAGAGASHYQGYYPLEATLSYIKREGLPIGPKRTDVGYVTESAPDRRERFVREMRTRLGNIPTTPMAAGLFGGSELGSALLEGGVGPSIAGLLGQAAAQYAGRKAGLITNQGTRAASGAAGAIGEGVGRAAYRMLGGGRKSEKKSDKKGEKTSMDRGALADLLGALGHGASAYGGVVSDRRLSDLESDHAKQVAATLEANDGDPSALNAITDDYVAAMNAANRPKQVGIATDLAGMAGSAVIEPEAHRFMRFLSGALAGTATGGLAHVLGAHPAVTGLATAAGHGLARHAIRKHYRAAEADKEPTEKRAYTMRQMLGDAIGAGSAAGANYLSHDLLNAAQQHGEFNIPSDVMERFAPHANKVTALTLGAPLASMAAGGEVMPALMGEAGNYAAQALGQRFGLNRSAGARAALAAVGNLGGRGLYRGVKSMFAKKPAPVAAQAQPGQPGQPTEKKAYDMRTFLTDALASASLGAGSEFGQPYSQFSRARREAVDAPFDARRKDIHAAYDAGRNTRADYDLRNEMLDAVSNERQEAMKNLDREQLMTTGAGHAGNVLAGLLDPHNRQLLAPVAGLAGAAAAQYGPLLLGARLMGSVPPQYGDLLRRAGKVMVDHPGAAAALGSFAGRSALRALDSRKSDDAEG